MLLNSRRPLPARPPSRAQAGLSLVELMVGIGLGLALVAGLLLFFSNSLTSNRFAYQNSRLNQEMNAVMEMMVRDIRRAGFWGKAENGVVGAATNTPNPFTADLGVADGGIVIDTASACILFHYDRDEDGQVDDNEKTGFRLANNTLQIRLSSGAGGTASSCSNAGDVWESLTDPNLITLTGLTFTRTHVQAPSAGPVPVACIRNIDITLSGQLKSDALVTMTVRQSVRVRADWYRESSLCPA